MPKLDSAAIDFLDSAEVIKPAFMIYLDILGDPIRATTFAANLEPNGTGDEDLDGHIFKAMDPRVVEVGPVSNKKGGSDTLTISLSGLLLPDADLLAVIGDQANWRSRVARLWIEIRDGNSVSHGGFSPYYTGYMTGLDIAPSRESQVIQLKIENYLALLSEASNRTYHNQRDFDPGDLSAQASISAANGARTGPAAALGGGGSGGGKGFGDRVGRMLEV